MPVPDRPIFGERQSPSLNWTVLPVSTADTRVEGGKSMRRLLIVSLVTATTALVSAIAWAGNQEVAGQIAANLRASGQLGQCKITVKFHDGTAWIGGQTRDRQQMDQILEVVEQTPGVTRIVNEMTVGSGDKIGSKIAALNSLQRTDTAQASRAQPLGTTIPAANGTVPTAMMQPIPPPPGAPLGRPAPPAPLPGGDASGAAMQGVPGAPMPMYAPYAPGGPAPMRTDQPSLPAYAWPTYSAYPNYAAVTYPKQYSPTAWPYIGPFYPYPQVPLGWRKVSLQWDDGWWFLEFHDKPCCVWWR
jgi:hypothetical protein